MRVWQQSFDRTRINLRSWATLSLTSWILKTMKFSYCSFLKMMSSWVLSERLCRWRLHNRPGQPMPVLGHSHREKVFPDVQETPPVFQFMPIASGAVTGHHWAEPGSVLFAFSPWVLYMLEKSLLSLHSSKAKQSQLSQLLLIAIPPVLQNLIILVILH